MMLQRVEFINKMGDPIDMVLDIIKKNSKFIVAKNPEDGHEMNIPRRSVERISEPKKETE